MPEVVVVGGGIGGLGAAVALQREGVDAQVYEAAPELTAVGAGIWVPPNAMAALARVGLADAVIEAGLPLRRAEVRDVGAGVLQTLSGDHLQARWGFPIVSIRRSSLQRILADALLPGTLHLGRRLRDFGQEGTIVRASFEEGEDVDGALLVGADGIHSVVRRRPFPAVALRYSGQTCFRGLAAITLDRPLNGVSQEVWGGRTRFGFSGTGSGEVYWFAPMVAEAGTEVAPGDLGAFLREEYRSYPEPVGSILAATEAGSVIQTDLFDFAPLPRWAEGRVGLLGDAAHAMTPNLGQGGAQAIEDAIALARAVRLHGASERALQEYERVRRPKAAALVKLSWRLGGVAHWENPLLRAVRNGALRAIPARLQDRQLDELFTMRV